MFVSNIKRLHYVCDKIIIRHLRARSRKFEVAPNPGLDERLKVFQDAGISVISDDAEEYIEQSESDYSRVHETYKDHLKQRSKSKNQLSQHIVNDKYFKDKMPNLLTWSEKEQIRYLAQTFPDEWTPERLAESFPVTSAVVKKLLKYPWKPATEERIARHDASAMRNWKELKEGTLNIPKDLKKHFLKFSDRSIPPITHKSIKIDVTQGEYAREFENIIKKCAENDTLNKNYENSKNTNIETEQVEKKDLSKENVLVTLDELKNKIKKQLDDGMNIDIGDQIILNAPKNVTPELSTKCDTNRVDLSKNDSTLEEFKKEEDKDMTIITYPERIRIPKKAYKRGATYKVNNCYYDHDGRFLYRVIGMFDKK